MFEMFCEFNSMRLLIAALASASRSGSSRNPSVAKAHAMFVKFWQPKADIFLSASAESTESKDSSRAPKVANDQARVPSSYGPLAEHFRSDAAEIAASSG